MRNTLTALLLLFGTSLSLAQGNSGFNPPSPSVPNANYFDPSTGELVITYRSEDNDISDIIERTLAEGGGETEDVISLTYSCRLEDEDLYVFRDFDQTEIFDLSQAWGFSSIGKDDFKPWYGYESHLRLLKLPSCVTEISTTFDWARQLTDLYCLAPVPPTVPALFLYKDESTIFTEIYNPRTDVNVYVPESSLDAYLQDEHWSVLTLKPVAETDHSTMLTAIRLSFVTPEGDDRTADVSVTWTNYAGEVLSHEHTVRGLEPGTKVVYVTTLSNDLAADYKTPASAVLTATQVNQQFDIVLQPWPADAFSGMQLTTLIGYTSTHGETAASANGFVENNDLEFRIRNLTTDEALTNFVFDAPVLKLADTASPDDVIEVSLSSRSHQFRTETTQTHIDPSGHGTLTFALVENGHAVIHCDGGASRRKLMCLVFGQGGERLSTSYSVDDEFHLSSLPDGDNKAVIMPYDGQFSTVTSLAVLQELGLRQPAYSYELDLRCQVGLEEYYPITLPAFDPLPSYFTGSISLANSEVSATKFATATASYSPSRSGVSDVRLIVELPDGLQMLENSPISNHHVANYRVDGRRYIFEDSDVSFCVSSRLPATYDLQAYVSYTLAGVSMMEYLGSASLEVSALSFSAPYTSTTPTLVLYGYAQPGAKVEIYENDQYLDHTYAMLNGEWETTVTVSQKYPQSYHALHAEYVNDQGVTISTDKEIVYVDAEATVLKTLRMYNEHDVNVTFDVETGRPVIGHYDYNPYDHNQFTFVAEFENLDPDRVHGPRFYVSTSNNKVSVLRAHYNEAMHAYTATARYPSYNCMPTGVSFTFDYTPERDHTRLMQALAADDMAETSERIRRFGASFEPALTDVETVENSDTAYEIRFGLNGSATRYSLRTAYSDAATVRTYLSEHQGEAYTTAYNFHAEGADSAVFWTFDTEELMRQIMYDVDQDIYVVMDLRDLSAATGTASQLRIAPVILIPMLFEAVGAIAATKSAFEGIADMLGLQEVHEGLLKELQIARNQYAKGMNRLLKKCYGALLATCPDGSSRVKPELLPGLESSLQRINEETIDFMKEVDADIQSFASTKSRTVTDAMGKQVYGYGVGKLTGAAGNGVGGLVGKTGGLAAQYASGISSAFGQFFGDMADALKPDNLFETNYEAICAAITQKLDAGYDFHLGQLSSMLNKIHNSYKEKCKEDEDEDEIKEEEEEGKKDDEKPKRPRRPRRVRPILDPSGFVYEGVESNRVAGVTATVFYREDEQTPEESAEEWRAEEYGQSNPVQTDATGYYRWDVPEGLWQVRFHKEGYADVRTEWLPVPPPQLDVNVAMTRLSQPVVTSTEASTNRVTFAFDKYMDIASVTSAVNLMASGQPVAGHVMPTDEERGADGRALASRFCFEPDAPWSTDRVTLSIAVSAADYADNHLATAFSRTLQVEQAIVSLKADTARRVHCGEVAELVITAQPAVAVSGKRLSVSCGAAFVALDPFVEFDAEGRAFVYVESALPGAAALTFSIADQQAKTLVNFVNASVDAVCVPVASVLSGSTVEKGTAVELYSMTDGATIVYTLDGSCPCDDSPSVRTYTSPIIINQDVTIRAKATLEGREDSDVESFTYRVATTDIETIAASQGEELLFTIDGQRVQRPLAPGVYIRVSTSASGTQTHRFLIRN